MNFLPSTVMVSPEEKSAALVVGDPVKTCKLDHKLRAVPSKTWLRKGMIDEVEKQMRECRDSK